MFSNGTFENNDKLQIQKQVFVAEQAMLEMKNMIQKQKNNQIKHRPKSQNDISNMSNI